MTRSLQVTVSAISDARFCKYVIAKPTINPFVNRWTNPMVSSDGKS